MLKEGVIRIEASDYKLDEKFEDKFSKEDGKLNLSINSGTLELNDNKAIILAD